MLSATLVPIFVDAFDEGDESGVQAVLTVATVALVVLTVAAMLAAPLIFAVYDAPDGVEDAGVRLLVLFLPQMLFYGWMALGNAVLNAKRRFVVPAFAPVLNNIVVCAALIAFGLRAGGDAGLGAVTDDRTGLLLLGLGTTAGIVAMTLPLLPPSATPACACVGAEPRHAAVTTLLRRGGWTLGYVAANQIGLTVMLAVAARTTEGLPSWYAYAFIFFQLPHGLIAVSVMTTFVPELASAWGNDDVARYRAVLPGPSAGVDRSGPRHRRARGGLGAAGGRLLERAFGATAADGTADVLATMALGLPGFSAYLLRAARLLRPGRHPYAVPGQRARERAPGRPDRRPGAVGLLARRGPRHGLRHRLQRGRRGGPRPPAPPGRGDRHRPGRRRSSVFVAAAVATGAVLVVRSLLPDDTEALVEAAVVVVSGWRCSWPPASPWGWRRSRSWPAPSPAEGGRPSLRPHVQGDPSVVEVHDRQALLLVQREGRSQGPARAGDHGGPGAAPAAEGAGGERHRQPEADRAAPEPVLDELEKVTGNARQAVLMADEATKKGDADKATEYTSAAEAFANRLIALEAEVEDLKTLHLQSTQASDQAKAAVSPELRDAPEEALRAAAPARPARSGQDAGADEPGDVVAVGDRRRGRADPRRGARQDRGPLRQGQGHVGADRDVGREPDAGDRASRPQQRGPGPSRRDPGPARPLPDTDRGRDPGHRVVVSPAAEPAPATPEEGTPAS